MADPTTHRPAESAADRLERDLIRERFAMRSLLEFARTLTPDLGSEGIIRSVQRTIMGKGLITESFTYLASEAAFRYFNRIGFRKLNLPEEISFELLETWIVHPPAGCAFVLPIFDSEQQEIIAAIGFGHSVTQTIDIEDEPNYLESLSLLTGIALTNAKLFELEKQRQRLNAELRLAHEIQQSLLPQTLPDDPTLRFFAYTKQSEEIGGDYFDVLRINDNEVLVVIADVVGKGIGAALLMANLQASTHTIISGLRSTRINLETMVCELNKIIYESTTPERYITAAFALINTSHRTVQSFVCGHPHPLILSKGGATRAIPTSGVPLGIFETYAFEESMTSIAAGDRIVFYTDGISEAYGEKKMLGEAGVAELFSDVRLETNDDLKTKLQSSDTFSITDDITVVVADVL